MANGLSLGVDQDDIEKLLEVAPEELSNDDLLKLERKRRAEEVREKETDCRRRPLPKTHSEGFSRSF